MLKNLPKPLLFILLPAIGSLLIAAIIGESLNYYLFTRTDASIEDKQVDVMFVLDIDSEMNSIANDLQNSIADFTAGINGKKLDGKVGLVAFKEQVTSKPRLDINFIVDTTGSMQSGTDNISNHLQTFGDAIDKAGIDITIGVTTFTDRLFTRPQIDIGIAIDISKDMQPEVDDLRDNIVDFGDTLNAAGIDYRVGILKFNNYGETGDAAIQPILIDGAFFTTDMSKFESGLDAQTAGGGGLNESSFLGLSSLIQQEFRENAIKLLLLITDEPPLIPDGPVESTEQLVSQLKEFGGQKLYCVIDPRHEEYFQPLSEAVSSEFIPLLENGERLKFGDILLDINKRIATKFGAKNNANGPQGLNESEALFEFVFGEKDEKKLTSEFKEISAKLDVIPLEGGGDLSESIFDAVALTLKQPIRSGSNKLLIVVSDGRPQLPDFEVKTTEQMKILLTRANIDNNIKIFCIIDPRYKNDFSDLRSNIPIDFKDLLTEGKRNPLTAVFADLTEHITREFGANSRNASKARDLAVGQDSKAVLSFGDSVFTSSPENFQKGLSDLLHVNTPIPANSHEALAKSLEQDFRNQADRVLVLITNKPPPVPSDEITSTADIASTISDRKIDRLHLVTTESNREQYERLKPEKDNAGLFFAIPDELNEEFDFAAILADISTAIAAESTPKAKTTSEEQLERHGNIRFFFCLWLTSIAVIIGTVGVFAQHLYIKNDHFQWLTILKGLLKTGFIGVLIVGFGQFLLYSHSEDSSHLPFGDVLEETSEIIKMGFVLSVFCVGLVWSLSEFIPNTSYRYFILTGICAGIATTGTYFWAQDIGPLSNRLLMAATLGGGVGLAVVVSERLSRRKWLEIDDGTKQKVLITLGRIPLTFGSNSACSIRIPGVANVKYRFFMELDLVYCVDLEKTTIHQLPPNCSTTLKNMRISIREKEKPSKKKPKR